MRRIEPLLAASLQREVRGDERAVLEDTDFVGEHVHVEDAPARGVGDAVEIAADAHHAFMRSSPLEAEHGGARLATTPALRQRPH